MNRDQLADWLHCLSGGMYDWVVDEIKKELAKPDPEPVTYTIPDGQPLYALPPRKPWQGLTSEDWENTPDTSKLGCERDAELFDWIEKTLKDKNDTF